MRRSRSRFVLLLLVATALSLVTLDFRGFGPLETVQNGVRSLFQPLVGLTRSAATPVANAWHGVTGYGDLQRENAELRGRIETLESDPLRNQNAQQQLDEIKAQLGILTAANTEGRVARVIAGPAANFENNVRIDKGGSSGLVVDMVVVTDAGLVGRLVEVSDEESVVELADSRGFGVGVRPASAAVRTNFVLRGQGPGRPLVVQGELPVDAVAVGDAVVTSGLDRSIYPPDIVVGRVSRVPEPTAGSGNRVTGIEIEPVVDPSSLSFVTVLLWRPQR
jgi:rod shape-determining protein MreC